MQNALNEPQTIVLLGGTSEIGRAIVDELLAPATRTLVLACRRPAEAEPDRFARDGLAVVVEHFDAADTETHDAFIRKLAAEHGDIDVAIIAFGVLGSQADFDDDPAASRLNSRASAAMRASSRLTVPAMCLDDCSTWAARSNTDCGILQSSWRAVASTLPQASTCFDHASC